MSALDKPTSQDQLGFEPYVRGIDGLIRGPNTEELPFAIGVYGAWGSGKTSFMLQLQSRLQQQEDGRPILPTVWFDAWKYDRTEDVRSALIYKILFDLEAKAKGKGIKNKLTKSIKENAALLRGMVRNTSVGLGPPGISITLPSPKQVEEQVKTAKSFQTLVDKFEDSFSKAIQAFLEEAKAEKLVVFVDDLDRCLPQNVITILEALKLFLDKAPCVFVIGIDRAVVEKAIQAHYGSDPGVSGREYLDKIVQFPFTVPPADPEKLKKRFAELGVAEGLNPKDRQIFELAADGNPRIYLRLLHSWKVVASLAQPLGLQSRGVIEARMLMLATAIHVRFPRLHEVCRRRPDKFPLFYDRCVHPPREQIETDFQRNSATEYLESWNDPSIPRFFSHLRERLGEADDPIHDADLSLTREVFGLSARVS